jgi:hypothetical protein
VVAAEKLPQVGVSSNMTLLFFGCTAEAEAKRLFTTQELGLGLGLGLEGCSQAGWGGSKCWYTFYIQVVY